MGTAQAGPSGSVGPFFGHPAIIAAPSTSEVARTSLVIWSFRFGCRMKVPPGGITKSARGGGGAIAPNGAPA